VTSLTCGGLEVGQGRELRLGQGREFPSYSIVSEWPGGDRRGVVLSRDWQACHGRPHAVPMRAMTNLRASIPPSIHGS